MSSRKIRIMTDKSPVAHHHADLLAKGVKSSASGFQAVVGDLARSPDDAASEQTALEDIRLQKYDILLFSSMGALSLYEKHFREEEDRHPLHSKTIGIVLFPHSTFDSAESSHPTDKHLIAALNEYGLERDAILLKANSDNDDQEIIDLGKHFADQL
ncbi:hypothetical protein BCR42DRAFT_451316 [Absidia repens]|uniref:Uncharacterized protein n=1 Tax=Absidia repens TaxID=90262 RepID=A0A1X2IGW6_9FUNG|nr:hypothetical protein BCR42DRAFT_451316 [Absidia repens]